MSGISFFEPTTGPDAPCPVCGSLRPPSVRYPDHVCGDCVERATSEEGRALRFSNTSFGGGFIARLRDTGEEHPSHVCLIDGVRCWADEARFGGVVVRPGGAPPNPFSP